MSLPLPSAPVPNFATPDEAEQGFYECLTQANLEALMSIWADDDDIICIDPDGRRALGHAAIRQGWQSIFSNCHHLEIEVMNLLRWESGLVAVHLVQERVTLFSVPSQIAEANTPHNLMKHNGVTTALNIYVRGSNGWRLVCHQATSQLSSIRDQINAITQTVH